MVEEVLDVVVWVGGAFYSRESFLKEAIMMGACRRIGKIPNGLKTGVSRVILVSDMSNEDRKVHKEERKRRDAKRYRLWKEAGGERPADQYNISVSGAMPRGEPKVFAWYTVRSISYVVPMLDEEIKKKFEELGIDAYEYVPGNFGFNDERGCGSLDIGGTYLLSEEDLEKCKDLAENELLHGQINTIIPPIPYDGKRFRGVKTISRVEGSILIGTQTTLTEAISCPHCGASKSTKGKPFTEQSLPYHIKAAHKDLI